MNTLNALWRAAWIQIGDSLVTPAALVVGIVQPAVFIAIAELGHRQDSQATTIDVVVGGMLLSLWSSTLWAAGSVLRRERMNGTLAALVVRPTPLLVVLAGRTLGASVLSAAEIVASGSIVTLLMGTSIHVGQPMYAVLVVALSLLSCAALGIVISCLSLLTRAATRVIEALTYPVFLLGGLIIPTSELPSWLRYPSWIISLHWAAIGIASGSTAEHVVAVVAIAGLTLGYWAGALLAARMVLDRTRKMATLEVA